jgi:type IV pilus assembly protein PilW
MMKPLTPPQAERGFSLPELMVGILIGLMAMYATYAVFQHTESNQRKVASVNDAQMSGLYASYQLSQDVANSGSVIIPDRYDPLSSDGATPLLLACPVTSDQFPISAGASGWNDWSFHPIPALIKPVAATDFPNGKLPVATDANGNRQYDVLNLYYAEPSSTDMPLSGNYDNSTTFSNVPEAYGVHVGDVVLGVNEGSTPSCVPRLVSQVDAIADTVTGIATDTLTLSSAFGNAPTRFIDLGKVVRRTFYVNPQGTLEMATWDIAGEILNGAAAAPRIDQLASNVALFRVQYGIDTNNDGAVDLWVSPTADDWTDAIPSHPAKNDAVWKADTIKALRVAIVLRSDEPDRSLANAANYSTPVPVFSGCENFSHSGDCNFNISLPASNGTFGYRFRTYQSLLPMLNTVWSYLK